MKEKDLASVIGDVNEEYVMEAGMLRRRSRAARIGMIAAALALIFAVSAVIGANAVKRDVKTGADVDLRIPAVVSADAVYPPKSDSFVLGNSVIDPGTFQRVVDEADYIILGTVKNWVSNNDMLFSLFEVEVNRSYKGEAPETMLIACDLASWTESDEPGGPVCLESGASFYPGYRALLLVYKMQDAARKSFGIEDRDCYWTCYVDAGIFDLVSDGEDLYVYARDHSIGEKLRREFRNYAGIRSLTDKLFAYLRVNEPNVNEEDDRFTFLFKLDDLAARYFE